MLPTTICSIWLPNERIKINQSRKPNLISIKPILRTPKFDDGTTLVLKSQMIWWISSGLTFGRTEIARLNITRPISINRFLVFILIMSLKLRSMPFCVILKTQINSNNFSKLCRSLANQRSKNPSRSKSLLRKRNMIVKATKSYNFRTLTWYLAGQPCAETPCSVAKLVLISSLR